METCTATPLAPAIGAAVHATRSELLQPGFAEQCLELLEQHAVLVFPGVGLSDEEQLAFTDSLGANVNFASAFPGSVGTPGIYVITLDEEVNADTNYALASMFWHLDGLTADIPPPKATIVSCRRAPVKGGQTEFANTYAAYEALPDDEKAEFENLRVVHKLERAMREILAPEDIEPARRAFVKERPLIWTHESGRKSLLVGYTTDEIVGMPKVQGRALLARLLEWAAQPAFTYRHHWQEGDLVMWDNRGVLHRVLPYTADSGRSMHRTSVSAPAGVSA